MIHKDLEQPAWKREGKKDIPFVSGLEKAHIDVTPVQIEFIPKRFVQCWKTLQGTKSLIILDLGFDLKPHLNSLSLVCITLPRIFRHMTPETSLFLPLQGITSTILAKVYSFSQSRRILSPKFSTSLHKLVGCLSHAGKWVM